MQNKYKEINPTKHLLTYKVFGDVLEETSEHVKVKTPRGRRVLKRSRMYNAHIIEGALFCDYQEKASDGEGVEKKKKYEKRK